MDLIRFLNARKFILEIQEKCKINLNNEHATKLKHKENIMNNNLNLLSLTFVILLSVFCFAQNSSFTTDWTHFRGSDFTATANTSEMPVTWNNESNILWKTAIHGRGWSSPVVYDNQIWVTTADPAGKKMSAVAVDFTSGKILFDMVIFEPDSVYPIHPVNSYATPTPCIENGFVYIHFGQYGTARIDTKSGKKVWERTDLFCKHVQGPGSSPILYKNLLILHLEGTDVQFIIALDKTTGKTVWRTDRPADLYKPLDEIGRKAYITPIIVNVDGKDLLISNGAAVCIAYDVMTGKEVWRIVQGEDSTISMPTTDNKTVYFYTGFFTKPDKEKVAELLAVDPSGKGEVTKTHVLWRKESPILQMLTQLLKDGLIYTIDTKNKLMCLDASTGKTIWEVRARGKYNASPVCADGKIYFSSTNGKILVIKEGRTYQLLAENQLEGEIWATPAVVNNSLLIRTSIYLYRIGKKY